MSGPGSKISALTAQNRFLKVCLWDFIITLVWLSTLVEDMAFQRFLSLYPDQTGSVWSWSRQQTPVINRSRRRRQDVTDRAGESAVWGSDPH